jgi:hypothetical protein
MMRSLRDLHSCVSFENIKIVNFNQVTKKLLLIINVDLIISNDALDKTLNEKFGIKLYPIQLRRSKTKATILFFFMKRSHRESENNTSQVLMC